MVLAFTDFELEWLVQEQERLARLEEKVAHIESGVTDLRTDVRRIDAKIDAVKDLVSSMRLEMKEGLARLEKARVIDRLWWMGIAATLLGVMARGFHWI